MQLLKTHHFLCETPLNLQQKTNITIHMLFYIILRVIFAWKIFTLVFYRPFVCFRVPPFISDFPTDYFADDTRRQA
jgi:hypothetical protein